MPCVMHVVKWYQLHYEHRQLSNYRVIELQSYRVSDSYTANDPTPHPHLIRFAHK